MGSRGRIFLLSSTGESGGRFGQSQSSRTRDSIIRLAAREASVFDSGSTVTGVGGAESERCELALEPLRRRCVKL
jgi:hypothetical protein